MKSSSFKQVVKYLLLLGIGALLLWLAFKGQNLNDIFEKIIHAHPLYLILSLLAGLLAFLLRAWRWNMLIEPMGYRAGFLNASYALGIGYFANLAIPRIGEITRCGVLSKAEKIPAEKLIGTVITERVIDVIMLLLSMMVVAILQYDLLMGFLNEKVFINPARSESSYNSILLIPAALFVILFFFILISKNPRAGRIREKALLLVRGVVKGLLSVAGIRNKWTFVFHTFLIWALYFVSTYLCFFSLDATRHLGMSEGMFLLVAGGLGMSAPVQGGIGAYHYIVSQALMLFGISQADGIAYATLVHTLQLILIIVLGLISLFMIAKFNKQ